MHDEREEDDRRLCPTRQSVWLSLLLFWCQLALGDTAEGDARLRPCDLEFLPLRVAIFARFIDCGVYRLGILRYAAQRPAYANGVGPLSDLLHLTDLLARGAACRKDSEASRNPKRETSSHPVLNLKLNARARKSSGGRLAFTA